MIDLTIPEAQKILNAFSCTQIKNVESETEKQQLRRALILFAELSERENLGVCADNAAQGFAALESYLKAMGYDVTFQEVDLADAPAPIYIKFNTQKLSHYFDSYIGDYRGVLVSCQSEDDEINGTYGHFPLDLFRD
jgi:Domain of unknown function (DUF1824)